MKTVCLVFTIGWAVLMCGANYAAPVKSEPQQSSEGSPKAVGGDHTTDTTPADGATYSRRPSDEERNHRRVSDKNHPPSRASLPKANHPNQLSKSRERSTSGNHMNLRQPGSDKFRDAVKGGLVQNETVNNALRVRPPNVVRPVAPALSTARHRGPNPAVIGGSVNSITRNIGTINGTHMNRKP
jgi:hypothetical protein